MTVKQLKRLLEDYDDDDEIRLACQPKWAFEYEIEGLRALSEIERKVDEDEPDVIYILEGRQIGYCSGELW